MNEAPVPKWPERMKALTNVGPVFRMVWDAAPNVVIGSLICRVTAALIPLATLAVTKVVIDSIVDVTAHQRSLPWFFWWLVAGEFVLAGIATVLVRTIDFFDTILADRYTRYVSTRIMEHASRLDLTRYEDPLFCDKMERARVQGTDRLVMIQATGRLVQEGVTTVSLAAGIFFYSPVLLAILVLCVVPAFLGETHFAFIGYSLNFLQTPAKREMEYVRVLSGSKETVKEVKLFRLGPFLVSRYKQLSDELHRQNLRLAKRKLYFGALLTLLGTFGYYATYAFVVYKTVIGAITLGALTMLAGAIAGASSNIQQFFSTFSQIADQALFLNDLMEFFSVQPRIVSKPNALVAPRPIRTGFEFQNVSFSYAGSSRRVLDGISFRLEAKERVALVGANGQGKTTIVKLITRLYDPSDGQILLDGADLREYDIEELWKEIGVIFQDFVKYDFTVRRNISVGRIEEGENLHLIQHAARKSLAEQVIQRLPNRYDQLLGTRFESGLDLSGGEWQKIALARAYLRDAQMLILDEPTAALDAESEQQVFARFAELTTGKMSLFISHRFSTVRMADRILVLADGKIAEEGAHDQLVAIDGHYAEMFEMQAANYR
jgi:ATP-binding cassette subfamily B protein